MNKQTQERIYTYWSQVFETDVDLFSMSGSKITANKNFEDSGTFSLSIFPKRSFILSDPALVEMMEKQLVDELDGKRIIVEDVKKVFADHTLEHVNTLYIEYLDPEVFQPVTIDSKYSVRPLQYADQGALDLFRKETPDEELAEGEVELNHPLALGAFYEDKLVAIASYFLNGEYIADVGEITHPEFRRQGLAKVLVAQLCEELISMNKIVQYRYQKSNIGSGRVSRSLGFTPFVEMHWFEVT